MASPNYEYNHATLSYEIVNIPLRRKLRSWLVWLLSAMAASTIFILSMSHFMETPKTIMLRRQIESIQMKYASMLLQLQDKDKILDNLMQRDNSVYRSIFEAEKIPISMREGEFEDLLPSAAASADNPEIVWQTTALLAKITKKTYIQSKSFDEIATLAMQKEQMIVSIPSIQPVSIADRRIHISAVFGWRRDPVFRSETRMHDGIDFAGPVGMLVYATGNGRVTAAEYNFNGYGNHVVINHGFGYETRYAHLSRISVHPGDYVKRGSVIGMLGDTGKSTGPHLHYEVRYHGRPVNPINFFADDISKQDFDKIIKALQGDVRGGTEF